MSAEKPRHIQQTRALVDGKQYIARRIVDIDSFAKSHWNSRRWTMQEALFSRRCLCSTDDEVVLWCRSYTYREVMEDTSIECRVTPVLDEKEQGSTSVPTRMSSRQDRSLDSYMELVGSYTSRDLSYGTDALDAFAGISQRIEVSLRTRCYFGLPAVGFLKALLWLPKQRFTDERSLHQSLPGGYFPIWS